MVKTLDTKRKHRNPTALVLLCFIVVMSLAACGNIEPVIVDSPVASPIETVEATNIPTESIDHIADEAETIEITASF